MNDDQQSGEPSLGARLDAALDWRLADRSKGHATASVGRDEELPRAYPAEILEDAAGSFVASFPDLPEAPSTAGPDATDVLARLPRALLTGLGQVVREGRPMPVPSEAQGKTLIVIPTEALPRLLLHQRMLAAGLDDAEVERRLGSVPGWSVAVLRDPLVPTGRRKPNSFDLDLVMAALWVVQGGSREGAFGPVPVPEGRDDLQWSHGQAALLTLTLAGVKVPGLEVARVVDELGDAGAIGLCKGHEHLTRGVQLLMEAMAVQAAMGPGGEAAVTLLLRRAAEGLFGAKTYLKASRQPYINLVEIWREARWITVSRLENIGLSAYVVPPLCPVPLDVLLRTFSSSDIRPAVLQALTVEKPGSKARHVKQSAH